MRIHSLMLASPFLVLMISCQSTINKAVKETKYSAYEMIGIEKRDLFKREAKKVKSSQEDTQESFQDALERLQSIYGSKNSKLEAQYKSLNSAYEKSKEHADEVRQRIHQLETVAEDLFNEWRNEISEMNSAALRSQSENSLQSTRLKYNDFHTALKKSESKMDPVLKNLRDQVLFLKHNLNAQAIAGLKSESVKIQNDIETLLRDMKTSIQQAEEFIKSMQ